MSFIASNSMHVRHLIPKAYNQPRNVTYDHNNASYKCRYTKLPIYGYHPIRRTCGQTNMKWKAETSTNIQIDRFLVFNIHPISSRSRESPTCKLSCHLLLIHKVHDHMIDIHHQSMLPIILLDFEGEDVPMEGQSSYRKEYEIKMKIAHH